MMGNPVDDLSAATAEVLDAFRSALDSLNEAANAHKQAANMLNEEVRHKTAGGYDHGD
jgi:hypothetical protein